jgi:hypothetical protein
MLAKDRLIAKPLVYLGELATRYFKQQVSLWVAQQLLWVKARIFRTQLRGTRTRTRTRKRVNRFKAIVFSRKLEPQYLARISTTSQYVLSSTSTQEW